MQTQREAVYNAVISVFKKNGIDFKAGQKASESLTTETRAQVIEAVIASFNSGETRLAKEFDAKGLKNYCNGLVSNWLRKDQNLNGGEKYEIQNPGSRAGQGSPEIKEMRKLLKTVAGTANEAAVQAKLNSMIAAHKATKVKKVTIDADLIPEEFKALIG